ncbi:putative histone-lysine N-methyltransferase SUVR3 [Iris pallida]|uniref:Histone-lysine N-methyltransferase SUVR3 n=1 Tax=Iris pallida TaxID=29817 RepID=A0AAX6EBH0_IRIPA|nr:putative histone-lysine N-methyltransferase SUVR3 [Iris pallida]
MKSNSTEREDTPELQEWAELVLPYLPPPSLAAAAAVCHCLRRVSLSVSAARASDASRSLEALCPIPFLDPLPHPRYSHPYSYFIYTPVPLLPPPPRSQPWGTKYHRHRDPLPPDPFLPLQSFLSATSVSDSRCRCADDCSTETDLCPCSVVVGGDASECGAGCGCGPGCANRRTQRGVGARLRVVRSANKGWGLHAAETVKSGQFVCEYAGEFLTTDEARRRQRIYDELASSGKLSPALLVVREHLPSGKACLRVNIDATVAGNVARFINHSCDGGNLSSVLVRSSGSLLPRLCFFAAKDISEGEELTFSYGEARLRPNGLPCFCGSDVCVGLLPAEET